MSMVQSNKQLPDIGADSPTVSDLLGFEHFAEPIALGIANATGTSTPLTIGVYGEWGSGKTSFLKMLAELLSKKGVHPVWFNAWKYDREENLWSALIQSILDRTTVAGPWYRRIWIRLKIWRQTLSLRLGSWNLAKALLSIGLRSVLVGLGLVLIFGSSPSEISDFINQVSSRWFTSTPIALGFVQTAVLKSVAALIAFFASNPEEWLKLFSVKLGIDFSAFSKTKSYRARVAFLDEFNEEFRQIIKLAGNGKPLVVIIDDLDRCLPDKAIQVLEAMKLFLDVEGCIFLIAVDRDIVEKAIAAKYKDLNATTRDTQSQPDRTMAQIGEDYFEKIVQLPFTLPPIADKPFMQFVSNVYPDEDVRRCSKIFYEGLPRNPRKVKRLLHAFFLLRSLAADGIASGLIRASLIAKMVVIQSQFRNVFEDLSRFNTLLAELEATYRRQASSFSQLDDADPIGDPVLRERVKTIAAQFPRLRKVLLQRVDEGDTFTGVDIEPYLSLTNSTIDAKPAGAVLDEESATALGEYLGHVIGVTQSQVEIRGLSMPSSSSKFDIEDSYLATSVRAMDGEGPRLGPKDVLSRAVRSLILGAPGSGKSAFLFHIARTFARSFAQDDVSTIESRFGVSERLLPIIVQLRDFGRFSPELGAMSAMPAGFLESLAKYFEQWKIGVSADFFARYLERGDCILLLDGLDEVAPEVRQVVARSVLNLGRRYPTVRMVVTCREAAYDQSLDGDFSKFVISDLDQDQIRELVHKSYLRLIERDPIRAGAKADALLAAIASQNDLRSLATNPLLLTILISYHYRESSLPLNRANLYETSLNALLSRIDLAREFASWYPDAPNIDLQWVKSALATIALLATESASDGIDEPQVVSILAKSLIGRIFSEGDANKAARTILVMLRDVAGILVEDSGIYRFSHSSFREYLAAVALTDRVDYQNSVLERHKSSYWHDSIVFSVARTAMKSITAAEKVIGALLDAGSVESVLLAGDCLSETSPVTDAGLVSRTTQLLTGMISTGQIVGDLREKAVQMVNRLELMSKSALKSK